jgi:Zn-dependent metalloprotease
MNKFISRAGMIMLAIFITVGIQISDLTPQTERQIMGLNQLMRLDTAMQISWDHKVSVPTRLQGKLSEAIQADAPEIAMQFFNTNKSLFSMTDPTQEMEVIKSRTDNRGWKHVRMQQKFKSLRVEGKTYLVHINPEKEVRMVNGNYLPQIQVDTTPVIDSTTAIATARNDLNPQQDLTLDPVAELVIYQFDKQTYLSWKTILVSERPMGEFVYYIDAVMQPLMPLMTMPGLSTITTLTNMDGTAITMQERPLSLLFILTRIITMPFGVRCVSKWFMVTEMVPPSALFPKHWISSPTN